MCRWMKAGAIGGIKRGGGRKRRKRNKGTERSEGVSMKVKYRMGYYVSGREVSNRSEWVGGNVKIHSTHSACDLCS